MKRVLLATIIATISINMLQAKDNYMDKIAKLYSLKTNGALEFNITKTKDGYDLYPSSIDGIYKKIFSKKPMHIKVDEGPTVTTPHFTFATAGLVSEGNMLDFFNQDITKGIKESLKSGAKFRYEAIVSFGNKLTEKSIIEQLDINSSDTVVKTSKILINNEFDLDSFTGKSLLKVDDISINSKDSALELKDFELETKVTQEPIDNYMLFANSTLSVKKFTLDAKDRKKQDIHIAQSAKVYGNTIRVDRELLDLEMGYDIKALDAKTIALQKGVQESTLDLKLKNLGIKGVLGFLKVSKELDKINAQLVEAAEGNDNTKMQKIIIKQQEIINGVVGIFNNTFISSKSRVVLNLNLKSDKLSFVKLNLLYKGKPISGNVQSAFIALAAQQLALFDGDFEVQLDSQLATSINPLAIMGLDLLKAKGFATVKDGVYHLKGQIKDGKIVINGKAYTIPELTKALF